MKPRHRIIHEYLFTRDRIIAKQFERLLCEQKDIAAQGIERHIRACQVNKSEVDLSAFREIIADASHNRSIAMENQADSDAARFAEPEIILSDLFSAQKPARARSKARRT